MSSGPYSNGWDTYSGDDYPEGNICRCEALRKKGDYRACPFCAKNYRPDCLCNGVGCVKCCGPS